MNDIGKWLLGFSAYEKIYKLKSKLDNKQVEIVNQFSPIMHSEYQPWMCMQECYPYFINENDRFNETLVVNDLVLLNKIQDKFINTINCSDRVLKSNTYFYWQIETIDKDYIDKFFCETQQVLEIIYKTHFLFEKYILLIINLIYPLKRTIAAKMTGAGLSTHFFRGGVFLIPPEKSEFFEEEYAINIVHELAHQVYFLYQNADPIFKTESNLLVYSVIKKVERPIALSFHALVATYFMYIYSYYFFKNKNFKSNNKKIFIINKNNDLKRNLEIGLNVFKNIEFTELGELILQEMNSALSLTMNKEVSRENF
ncbi:hypothetical protein [Fluviispira vulneris]|uniref:hypothetical protein n=1 Tax=Fluviispira vulneris TaxID=2763012 RepID=UPI0016475899|nr:hypothetical protein [Fluviispira vulneris]